jgi:hypothetical protein
MLQNGSAVRHTCEEAGGPMSSHHQKMLFRFSRIPPFLCFELYRRYLRDYTHCEIVKARSNSHRPSVGRCESKSSTSSSPAPSYLQLYVKGSNLVCCCVAGNLHPHLHPKELMFHPPLSNSLTVVFTMQQAPSHIVSGSLNSRLSMRRSASTLNLRVCGGMQGQGCALWSAPGFQT